MGEAMQKAQAEQGGNAAPSSDGGAAEGEAKADDSKKDAEEGEVVKE
jgi:hypothetical protein